MALVGVLSNLLGRRADALESLQKAVSYALETEGPEGLSQAFIGQGVFDDLQLMFKGMDTRRSFNVKWENHLDPSSSKVADMDAGEEASEED